MFFSWKKTAGVSDTIKKKIQLFLLQIKLQVFRTIKGEGGDAGFLPKGKNAGILNKKGEGENVGIFRARKYREGAGFLSKGKLQVFRTIKWRENAVISKKNV